MRRMEVGEMSYFNSGSYISSTSYHTRYRNRLKMLFALIAIVIIAFNVFLVKTIIVKVKANNENRKIYNRAVKEYESGCDAYDIELMDKSYQDFSTIEDYKDSKEYMNRITEEKSTMIEYESAVSYYESGDYANALSGFHNLGDYRDSVKNINSIADSLYSSGKSKMDNKEYDEARKLLLMIPEYTGNTYENAQTLLASIEERQLADRKENDYQHAVEKFNSGDYASAQTEFMRIREYSNSEDYIDQIGSHFYTLAQELYNDNDYSECLDSISHIDTESEWKKYNEAISLKESLESQYKGYVEETAKQKLDNEGYAAFEQFINGSVNDFYSKNEADSLLREYEPVYLDELTSYDSGEWESAHSLADWGFSNTSLKFENNIYDEDGNCHQHCMVGGGCYEAYHLGDGTKYKTLNGVMFVIQGHRATKEYPVFLLVRDGEGKDLYRKELYSGYGNESFSIDVSGVTDVIIYMDGYDGSAVWDSDMYGSIGEFCLMK